MVTGLASKGFVDFSFNGGNIRIPTNNLFDLCQQLTRFNKTYQVKIKQSKNKEFTYVFLKTDLDQVLPVPSDNYEVEYADTKRK